MAQPGGQEVVALGGDFAHPPDRWAVSRPWGNTLRSAGEFWHQAVGSGLLVWNRWRNEATFLWPWKTMIYYEILRQPWATLFLGEPTQGDMAKSNRFNIDMPDIMGMVVSHGPVPPWWGPSMRWDIPLLMKRQTFGGGLCEAGWNLSQILVSQHVHWLILCFLMILGFHGNRSQSFSARKWTKW